MKVHHAHMSSVIFNIKDGISPWGKEINKPLRNPIQVGTEYILHLDIQNTFIKVFLRSFYLFQTLAENDYLYFEMANSRTRV